MGNPNILLSDRVRILGVIDPDVQVAGALSSEWVAMADVANLMAIVMVGTMVTASTVDAKLEQATDSGGTGVKDITGKAITQLTEAGTDDDKQAIINLRPDELDTDNDFTHARLTMTVAVDDSDTAALVLISEARYEPLADLASVDEIVS